MKEEKDELNQVIDRLLDDPGFSRRTASSVIAKSKKTRAWPLRPFLLAAAAVTIACTVLLLVGRNQTQPSGLSTRSADELATEAQSESAWAQTDDVISSALANR